ncbi:MAG: hypothetical protein H7287_02015 [Thermoleophilia bacterium]|nr:hypothetical protein [Thermoleophilia bacterium]
MNALTSAPTSSGAAPAALVAERIVQSQVRVVGPAAWKLARRVKHLDVAEGRQPRISPDADAGSVIDRLVREYSSITGDLGTRMCFMAAADILREHPELDVPCFRPFRGFV